MKRHITIVPTPKELAIEFCKLSAERRVDFLVEVAREIESYGNTDAAVWMLDMAAEIREAGGLAEKLVNAWATQHKRPAEDT